MRRLLLAIPLLTLVACKNETPLEPEPIKAVKTITIREATKANSRQISGIVKSDNESAISFRVGGNVTSVNAKAGDRVHEGQILATLEAKAFELSLKTIRAKLSSARSDFAEKREALTRQKNLRKQDFVAQAAVDQALAAFNTAKSNVEAATAELESAEDKLKYTELKAPFDGTVVARSIEAFTEVTAGQVAFEIQSDGHLKVEVLMPETLIRDVSYGDRVAVAFPTLKDISIAGEVSLIGAKAESGNAFVVKVNLLESPSELLPGMTAKVIFNFGQSIDVPVYLIPVSALDIRVPVESETRPEKTLPIFVINNGVAEKRMVKVRDIRGNQFEVIDGLEIGETIIVAGVPYVSEGQKVKPWNPRFNLPATISSN